MLTAPDGAIDTGWPAAVITGAGAGDGRDIVDVPTTRPLSPCDINVPARVTACALLNVVPAIATPFERMVRD